MNRRMILYLLGRILTVEAALMAPSAALAAIYGEGDLSAFLISMALLLAVGLPLSVNKPENSAIYAREGLVTVALAWVLMSAFGALPMVISGAIPSYVDALFEIVSGFTTTGASILSEVESLPRGVLFWRSFSHWVGGMGVLVFVMAVLPMSDDRSMVLMRAEVPGPTASKLVPRMRQTAKILYGTYSVMTLVLIVLLLLGGMPAFDAVCNAMGAAGTGGFSVRNIGIAYYDSAYADVVLSVFMLLFSINFNLYYLILIRRVREALRSEELRWFVAIVAGATVIVTLCVLPQYGTLGLSLRHAFFQVSSIISTTGYATTDFALWPVLAQEVLLVLMFIGACARLHRRRLQGVAPGDCVQVVRRGAAPCAASARGDDHPLRRPGRGAGDGHRHAQLPHRQHAHPDGGDAAHRAGRVRLYDELLRHALVL